jgi:type 1 glutamine amidotransferase
MLGGRFVSHPEIGTFRVRVEADHPVTAGVADFDINDERYVIEMCSEVHSLLAPAASDAPMGQTLGWVRSYGAGKICYLALGHGREQLQHPALRRLVTQALAWFGA